MRLTALAACVMLVWTCASATPEDESLAVLRDALANGTEWVKVHAAESLIWTGHPEGVRGVFLKELDGAQPPYRIGVWRVLAQGAEGEAYLDKIRGAFLDVDGPDRLHAVETLAKLGCAERPVELQRVAREEVGSFQVYARWALANSGTAKDEAALAGLLDSDDAGVRGCVAYALRFFERLRPESYAKLKGCTLNASNVYLLSALYVHAPEDEKAAAKAGLAAYAETGNAGEKREVCAALGKLPDPADVPLLTRLLHDEEMDVRSAAAEALLRF